MQHPSSFRANFVGTITPSLTSNPRSFPLTTAKMFRATSSRMAGYVSPSIRRLRSLRTNPISRVRPPNFLLGRSGSNCNWECCVDEWFCPDYATYTDCSCSHSFVFRENRVPYYQRLFQNHDGKRQWWKVSLGPMRFLRPQHPATNI